MYLAQTVVSPNLRRLGFTMPSPTEIRGATYQIESMISKLVSRSALRRCCSFLFFVPVQTSVGDTAFLAAAVGFFLGVLTVAVVVLVSQQRWNSPRSRSTETEYRRARDLHTGGRKPTPFDRGQRDALTDEELIVELLVSRGGRMKQSQIVDETDWSKAKVSRLLSKMDRRGEVTKVARGRENIVFLGSVERTDIQNRMS